MLSMNRATRQRYTQAPSQKAVSQGRGVLKRGHKGANVATLQNQLNAALGTKLKADGVLGPKTERALKQFQQKAGIGVDGVVGRQTLRALSQVRCSSGDAQTKQQGRQKLNRHLRQSD